MKNLTQYITEYLIKKKVDKVRGGYKYHPQTKNELINNINEILKKGETDLNCIDTSNIIDMSYLFIKCYKKYRNVNFNVSEWDVSNVTNMESMFDNCINFDCDLSNWNVSNVKTMIGMFNGCDNFTGKGLENWDVSNVKYMSGMFTGCFDFDCDLTNWNVSKVYEIEYMFYNCDNFTGKGLEKWNVSKGANMKKIFYGCKSLKNKPSWYKG